MYRAAFVALALSLFPSLVAGQAPSPFGVIAIHSGSPIQNQAWAANGGTFWIGKPTASFCPEPVNECPPGTDTAFVGGQPTLSMDVVVPGGQQVIVRQNGLLQHTIAHDPVIGPNDTLTGFTWRDAGVANEGVLAFTELGATGFVACPTGTDGGAPYQIYANIASGNWTSCLGFVALTVAAPVNETPAAWQYE